MLDVLQNIASFILVIGVLVTFHEFGHFWVARRLGVRVQRFSIGFGQPIRTWVGSTGTEYVLARIPLGGYVKMLDERNEPVAEADLPYAFNRKPIATRIAVVSAGPVFNFLLAIVLYWAVFMIGTDGLRPLVGNVAPASAAMQAQLQPGDEIIAVADEQVLTWEHVGLAFIEHVLDGRQQVQLDIIDQAGQPASRRISLQGISADLSRGSIIGRLGMTPKLPPWPAVIDTVTPGGAAERAGLRAGDEVTSADGRAVTSWRDWVRYVQKKPGETMQLEVRRDGRLLDIAITPGRRSQDGRDYGFVGASTLPPPPVPDELRAVVQYPFLAAWGKAVEKTWQISHLTLRMLGKMLVGEASVRNISGPITIAQYAGQSASIGLVQFLAFMAIVSISLGVLNLLPIPVLDGGHLMYYLVELIKGSPVSERTQLLGQQMGLVILGLLMVLAFYNDVMRLL